MKKEYIVLGRSGIALKRDTIIAIAENAKTGETHVYASGLAFKVEESMHELLAALQGRDKSGR